MSSPSVYSRFSGELSSHWIQTTSGTGFLRPGGSGLLLGNDGATDQVYTNAQIDDYRDLSRADFLWRPPLRLTVRARFSHNSGQITGTAGFGFWNDPLRMTGLRRLALPQALWFFYAGPDADMRMALDQPGWGLKAAVSDTRTCKFLARAPLLALAPPLMRVPLLYRWLWPSFQRQPESPNDCSPPPCRTGMSTPSTGSGTGHGFFWMGAVAGNIPCACRSTWACRLVGQPIPTDCALGSFPLGTSGEGRRPMAGDRLAGGRKNSRLGVSRLDQAATNLGSSRP